jgi:GNAT superfamily N-acetyltransferase
VASVVLPPVTPDLIERLEAPLEAFGQARVEELARLPGNPLELRIERFGEVFAPAALAAPELDFVNRISGLGPRDGDRIGEILSFYGGLGLRPWLEVTPVVELELPAEAALLGFQSVLYGPVSAETEPSLPVRETDEAVATARLLLDAFGVPPEIAERHSPPLAHASARTSGRMFVVDLDDRPVAGAILTTMDKVGYLAMAGTLPEFRGRGCQSALIKARIAAAAATGCELIVATAAFGSLSQRNIERGGLRVAYTKPVLRLTPPNQRGRAATA